MTRGVVPSLLAAVLVALAGCARPAPPEPARRSSDIPLISDTLSTTGRFPRNATLATVLRGQQMREEIIPEIVALAGRVFDARRFKADHTFKLVRTMDGLLRL